MNSALRQTAGLAARSTAAARRVDGRTLATLGVVAAFLLLPDAAYAQAAGGGGDIGSFVQNLVNVITGTLGKSIAVLAIAITGITYLMGGASARAAGGVVLGIMLIFGASWVVEKIVGG